ncbi:MAG: efflux RND transporter periplasmic adaptor subunit [Holophaga sp.]|nr:efflux RND transporter periplasmic adaptor subunit [Holophaga sp.]
MKRLLFLSSLTLVLVGVACSKHEETQPVQLPTVKVRLASETDANQAGWVAVTLNATQRATLATRLAASVKKVHVTEGQHVAAGALLVSLSDDDLQGGLKAAETAVAAATTQVHRIENLAKQNASIQAEMDMATVQLAQANAALAGVKANIAYTQIRSPFAGVVQTRRVNEGDFVGPGMPLVEVEGQGAMEFTGSVSEGEAKGLKIGQTLPFEVEGKTGLAQITGLSTGGDPTSHRGSIRARVAKGGDGLRSGAFGRLKLAIGASKVITDERFVAKSSLVQRGELNGVFVVKDGKAELRWLSLGEPQGDRIPVRAGLAKGELVIDAPGELKDGQPIEVTK